MKFCSDSTVIFFFPSYALQVAGDCCGSWQSLPGQRKLPWAVLLHREAPEVLSDRSYSGGEISAVGWQKFDQIKFPIYLTECWIYSIILFSEFAVPTSWDLCHPRQLELVKRNKYQYNHFISLIVTVL